jgi:hypothetical protein
MILFGKFDSNDLSMTAATKLDKQINEYLLLLNEKQKRAILSVVKTFAEEQDKDLWEDKDFIEKLDKRVEEYESGKVSTLSLAVLEERARKYHKSRSKSHK